MGTHSIKYFLLNKNELAYEVLIRGVEPAPTVIELKKQIIKLTPSLPSTVILESGLDPAEDLAGAANSLKELTSCVKQLEEKYDQSLHERSRALCNHIYHRLKRIDVTEPTLATKSVNKEFSALYTRLSAIQRPSSAGTTNTNSQSTSESSATSPTVINCDHQLERIRPKFDGVSCVRAFLNDVKDYASIKKHFTGSLTRSSSIILHRQC